MTQQCTADELVEMGFIPQTASEGLKKDLHGAIAPFASSLAKTATVQETEKGSGLFLMKENPLRANMRQRVMKSVLRDRFGADNLKSADAFKKAFVGVSAGLTPYDLQAPSKHLVPWLTPLRESLPRIARPKPGTIAHWKAITTTPTRYSRGTLPATFFINEGARAPQIGLATIAAQASYTSAGRETSVSFEAESSSVGFEDALATSHFFTLETVMSMEEDALLGANNSLKLGTTNTPSPSFTGSGAFTGTFYAACVALTYEGYRNFVTRNGYASDGTPLVTSGVHDQQQVATTTADGKVQTVNGGVAKKSAASAICSPSSSVSASFTVVPKNGEVAYLWYVGATNSASAMYLAALTSTPVYKFTSSPIVNTNEALSAVTNTDFSVNDGTTGGGTNQVTAFDGLLTQAWNNTDLTPQNAYVKNLAGAVLTTTGKGNVVELDDMLVSMYNQYKVGPSIIWVHPQQQNDIGSRILNNTSAPLGRFVAESGGFELTGNGVVRFYRNPFVPGEQLIPIMIHPTIPPGTIVAYAKTLPSYYKTNDTPNVAEVLTRREYYGQEFALTSREYPYGVYVEEVLALYAPFCVGIVSGIGAG